MSKILRYKDKHGSYQLFFKDSILRGLVIGSVGEFLSGHFHADILALVAEEDLHSWAYYGDLLLCDGVTCEAEQTILKTHTFCIENGCCVDAYRIQSPLIIGQIRRISSKMGVKSNLDSQIFDHEEGALSFLHKEIEKYALHHPDLK